jgi:hypothetical protein
MAAGAGVAFAFALAVVLGALGWLEAGVAQGLSHPSERVHFLYRFAFPLLDAIVCGLLVGLPFAFVRVEARWLHAACFFVAFYVTEIVGVGPDTFRELVVAAPLMWLFPLTTCLVIALSEHLKRRAFRRT